MCSSDRTVTSILPSTGALFDRGRVYWLTRGQCTNEYRTLFGRMAIECFCPWKERRGGDPRLSTVGSPAELCATHTGSIQWNDRNRIRNALIALENSSARLTSIRRRFEIPKCLSSLTQTKRRRRFLPSDPWKCSILVWVGDNQAFNSF